MNKVGFVCFGEVNTPIEKLYEKHDTTLALLKEKFADWDILDAGLVIDDTEYKYADAAIEKLKAGDFECLLTVVCGWIPTHAVIRVTDNWRHLPILLWGLCGWKENGRIVTTAEQAGTTAIRPAYEALGYNFKYIYNIIGKEQPLDKVDAFVRAAHAKAMLRKTHVGSMGYRDMFLYGTCFEAQSMRSQIGPEVECFEMLEMVQNIEKLEQKDIDEGVKFVKENWVFKKECPEETIVNGVKYALAIVKKIKERGYEANRQYELTGKAMIVAYSRPIAISIYKKILEIHPDWSEKVKCVMTGSNNDPEEWHDIIGNKQYKKELAKKFKDNNDPLKIAIVVDMWLTGFDVPSLATMYVYKPMAGHNLMQAIARVNRVFKGKAGGLVVDYIGIAKALKEAMRDYTKQDRDNYGKGVHTHHQ